METESSAAADGGRRLEPSNAPKVGEIEICTMIDSMEEILEAPVYKDLSAEDKKAFEEAAPGLFPIAFGVHMARQMKKAESDVLKKEVGNAAGNAPFFHKGMRINASDALNRTEHFGEEGPNEIVLQLFLDFLDTCANRCVFTLYNFPFRDHGV